MNTQKSSTDLTHEPNEPATDNIQQLSKSNNSNEKRVGNTGPTFFYGKSGTNLNIGIVASRIYNAS